VERLDAAGWDVVIVSAGSTWYIERILERAGVRLTVHSNPGRIVEGAGLAMELPVASPFFSPETGIDKVAVVRDALSRGARVAFAGDGPPDLNCSLLVDDELRFARGWLAVELKRRGRAYRAFNAWSEIASMLA
jgi:2-hydroxy-3-keto-5-methylthiopentenyl-1-phosphate phosphatase